MIFLTDENISPYAARMLGSFDRKNDIKAHEDCFEKGKPDIEWILDVANWEPKPIIVCGDGRILRKPSEQTALRNACLMFVYLASGWTNLSWEDFAWKIVKAWPAIVQNVKKTRKPSVFEVSVKSGKVDLIRLISSLGR